MNREIKLLIIDDDPITRRLLQSVLQEAGFEPTTANDASSALTELQQNGLPHLILLDLGLPGMNGMTLGERIKRMGDVPIIIVSGEKDDQTRIDGISKFADDFITKPFNVEEVIVRVNRILSRISDYSYAQAPVVEVDDALAIDFANNRIMIDGNEVQLTPIETNLLHILLRNKGQVVSPDTLLARVWPNEEVYEDTLRVHMSRLRKKLQGSSDEPRYIHTERGVGYAFLIPSEHQ